MGAIIKLNKPEQKSSMSLEHAIAIRRSRRNFLSEALTFEQIGQLCWAAQGLDAKTGYRTAPSAGATYPLELFIVSDMGLFRYSPDEHTLEKLQEQDLRSALASTAWGQKFIKTAPLSLVFTADFSRTTNHYGKRGIRYVYMEAGHAAQNVYLQAESMGLGAVAIGAFEDAFVSKALSLPSELEPVYIVTVGYYKK